MRVITVTDAKDVPKEPIDGKPTLVYWNMVGLAQEIRLLLVHVGVQDWIDVRIEAGPADAPHHRRAWKDVKPSMHKYVPFPNLPYFMDEKVQISQSTTILRYLARRHQLTAPAEQEHRVDLSMDQLVDQETILFDLLYYQGLDATRTWFRENVPRLMNLWEEFLGEGDFVAEQHLSIADFKLYVHLTKLKIVQAEIVGPEMADFLPATLEAFVQRVEALPRIREYLKHPDYLRRPLNNPNAIFK